MVCTKHHVYLNVTSLQLTLTFKFRVLLQYSYDSHKYLYGTSLDMANAAIIYSCF